MAVCESNIRQNRFDGQDYPLGVGRGIVSFCWVGEGRSARLGLWIDLVRQLSDDEGDGLSFAPGDGGWGGFGFESCRGDALVLQELSGGLGAVLGEEPIGFRVAFGSGVAKDAQVKAGKRLEPGGEGLEVALAPDGDSG